jgi:hypothetical protein
MKGIEMKTANKVLFYMNIVFLVINVVFLMLGVSPTVNFIASLFCLVGAMAAYQLSKDINEP